MRIAQVTGFLGTGKTTFLSALAQELADRDQKVAIIVNDVGHINVDQKLMESRGLNVKEVAGGCICCEVQGTFTTTVLNLHMGFKPDIILVEPTGVAIPWGLKQAAEEASRRSGLDITHAPIVTFVDGLMLPEQMQLIGRLIGTQIMEADAVMINKVDICSQEDIAECERIIQELNPGVRILHGSGRKGTGVGTLADMILSEESGRYHSAVQEGVFQEQYRKV
ncbi:MAG: GTP-binding protein [Candidatus Methanomethylophilaceae archaeon]|nr:GTP-binding protein [Candidatus Methanomethylophilaceae archaeon]